MAIETTIRTLLLSQTGITSLAPARKIEGTIYPAVFCEYAVQGFEPPFILICQISQNPMLMFSGTTGMRNTEFDIDCYHVNYEKGVALSAAVEAFFNDYSGSAVNDTINAVILQNKGYTRVIRNMDGTDVRHNVWTLTYNVQHT